MGENTKIEWAHHTFNPWVGCTQVSAACDHCYARDWAMRTGHPELWEGERRRTGPTLWQQPIKWDRAAKAAGERHRVFCASLADVFDNQVPTNWRDDLWHLIDITPNLNWLLLTKRPQNIRKMLPNDAAGHKAWGDGWPNVWLGTTVEGQKEAWRVRDLLGVRARIHFLSCEPLLSELDLARIVIERTYGTAVLNAFTGQMVTHRGEHFHSCPKGIDWVICGGESGPQARPTHPLHSRSLLNQCVVAGKPFLYKQHGEWLSTRDDTGQISYARIRAVQMVGDEYVYRVGKKAAGRLLDGRTHDAFPEVRT